MLQSWDKTAMETETSGNDNTILNTFKSSYFFMIPT